MIWFRSLMFNLALWLYTASLIPLLPLAVSERAVRAITITWAKVALWLLRTICGLRVEVRGRDYLLQTPTIFASKHQSALDTIVMWQLFDAPVFILKKELLWLPVFGWYLACTHPIAINRKQRMKALDAIRTQAAAQVARGRHIIIYPEGTRTTPGQRVTYKTAGLSLLYRELGLPVVPVALNTGYFWGRNTFIKKPGTVVVELLPPIAAGQPAEQMLEQMQTAIETASDRLGSAIGDSFSGTL